MAFFPVKFYHDGMQGIPKVTGQVGSVIALLDAVKINGFNSQTFDSIVVTGNVAVATKSGGGHGFLVDDIILISGVTTPVALNSEWKVTAQTVTTVTFATTSISDQTATGTVVLKFAPIGGWEKVYSGTNLAVYRSTDILSNKPMFRVDDTATQFCSIRMYETMTDINTGVNQTPTTALQATFGFGKSSSADSTTRRSTIIGCSRAIWGGACNSASAPDVHQNFCYGELKSYKAGDVYCGFITAAITNTTASSGDTSFCYTTANLAGGAGQSGTWVQRNMANTGVSALFTKYSINTGISGLRTDVQVYPALSDGGVHISKVYASDAASQANGTNNKRGEIPGFYYAEEYQPGNHLQKVTLDGKVFIILGTPSQNANIGRAFFPLDDWYA